MIFDIPYWTRVLKKVLYVFLIVIGLVLSLKLAGFYMPFLIAFIISLLIEPVIRFIMKKMKFSRRTSSIIIFIAVSALIIGLLIWGIVSLISEASNLLQGLNGYIDKIYSVFQSFTNRFDASKFHLPNEITKIFENSTQGLLNTASNWIRNALNGVLNVVTSMPSIAIYFTVTIIALYFICVDKIYILIK